MTTRLPNDIARCWDEKCIHRSRCRRSLGRHDDGARDFILSCQGSPEQQAQEDWVPYPHLMPVEQSSEFRVQGSGFRVQALKPQP